MQKKKRRLTNQIKKKKEQAKSKQCACGTTFVPSIYTPSQKRCPNCAKALKLLKIKKINKMKARANMKNYITYIKQNNKRFGEKKKNALQKKISGLNTTAKYRFFVELDKDFINFIK